LLEEKFNAKVQVKDKVKRSRRSALSPFPPLWGKERMGGGVGIRSSIVPAKRSSLVKRRSCRPSKLIEILRFAQNDRVGLRMTVGPSMSP